MDLLLVGAGGERNHSTELAAVAFDLVEGFPFLLFLSGWRELNRREAELLKAIQFEPFGNGSEVAKWNV